jgi:hypothetical protein
MTSLSISGRQHNNSTRGPRLAGGRRGWPAPKTFARADIAVGWISGCVGAALRG